MLQKFLRVVEETKTIEPKDRLVIGVSGGPDSMCLLTLLVQIQKRLGLTLIAVHVNHKIRGRDAQEDAAFVEAYVKKKLHLPFYLYEADVREIAAAQKCGLEEAGREVRYGYFREVMRREKANKIVTAHHMEDQAETVLMRMIRGTSVEGLAGIQEIRQDGVIRPLLRFSKQEILEYLAAEGVPYRVDRSNDDSTFTRNLIRAQVMPLLKEINPDVCGALCRLSGFAQRDTEFMQLFTREAWQHYVTVVDSKTVLVDCRLLEEYTQAVSGRVLCQAVRAVGGQDTCSGQDVRALEALVRKGKNGKELTLFGDIAAVLEYGKIAIFRKVPAHSYCVTVPVGTGIKIPEAGMVFYAYFERKDKIIPAKNQVVFALSSKITHYTVRSRRPGDQYAMRGMEGHRVLKELFIDLKVPKRLRAKCPILEVDGEILWVFGARESGRYAVSQAGDTDLVLAFEYQFMENGADLRQFEESRNEARPKI